MTSTKQSLSMAPVARGIAVSLYDVWQSEGKRMTLVAAWIRRTVGVEELVVASDSRLTGGIALNHAPKLFPLQRADSLLAYCGPTVVAYPILLQVKASLDANERTRNRVIDVVDL